MAFDPQIFQDEIAVGMIDFDNLPAIAQDAMEAGFDGPAVVRMAILMPYDKWAMDQALPGMLAELGCAKVPAAEAAIRLAKVRARHILQTGENPLPSLPYFTQLMYISNWRSELTELGYLEDGFWGFGDTEVQIRAGAIVALENLLDPVLREQRRQEAENKRKQEWPYVFHSPGMRSLLFYRLKQRTRVLRVFLTTSMTIIIACWLGGHWLGGFLLVLSIAPLFGALCVGMEYYRLWRERPALQRQWPSSERIS